MTAQLTVLFTAFTLMLPSQRHRPAGKPAVKPAATKAASTPCGNPIAFQVLLDRQGFSPGEIDGTLGANLTHAIAALQAARKLQPTGQADCGTWHALGGETAAAATVAYTIAADDVKGPFEKVIPPDLDKQASLPAMSYRNPIEKLAERFHVSPALLQKMNPRAKFAAGEQLQVPAVTPFDADAKPPADPAAADVTIQVTKSDSSVRATRADGSLVFYAPVTTGSEHDPLPTGDWKVTGVSWRPVFHYNPNLFWDAKPSQTRATIKAGPNNPVGVVWIDLNIPHYGLHGTPEPSRVGHTESHGCVRLTNWDAVRLASLVKAGTPVLFR
jgi:lipoprotein-anchoring transpeptidase ErfK/SrfK